jgi:ABC-type polysaccharide/polyol phosphate export permease
MLLVKVETRAPNAVLDQSNLVKKMVFPPEIFQIVNLTAANIFLRDIGKIISVVVNICLSLTPVMYPSNLVSGGARGPLGLKPMLHVVEGYRTAFLGRMDVDVARTAYVLLVALAIFAVGGMTFKRFEPAFAKVL